MFYRSIMAKYANIRAYNTANEGAGEGGEGNGSGEQTTEDKAAEAEADKAVADAKKAAEDAAKAAAGSDDPKLKKIEAEKAELLREVMEKKEKLKSTTSDLAEARAALAAYDGVDPAKVKALMRKELEAEQNEALAKGDFERVKAMMVAEHEKALKVVKDELDNERGQRQADLSLIDDLTIGNAFGNSSFIRETLVISPAKTRQLYGNHFERQGGVVVAYDKPAGQKDRTLLVDAKGDPLPFEDALSRIVDADPEKKGLVKSRAKQGAGSSSEQGKGTDKKQAKSGVAAIADAIRSL